MKYPARSVFLIFVAFNLCLVQATAEIVLIPLGDLPGGYFKSEANDVSEDGSIVIGRSIARTGQIWDGFKWENGEMEKIGGVQGDTGCWPNCVSADGMITAGGAYYREGVDSYFVPFHHEGGWGTSLLGDIRNSVANGISADGRIFVGEYARSLIGLGPVYWKSQSQVVLDGSPLVGYDFGSAYDISGEGDIIVGMSSDNAPYYKPAYWTKEGGYYSMTLLKNINGTEMYAGKCLGISKDGSVIVGTDDPFFDGGPFVAERLGDDYIVIHLGILPNYDSYFGMAMDVAVTESDTIVVGYTSSTEYGSGSEAVMWRKSNNYEAESLNKFIDEQVEILNVRDGFVMTEARAISDNGEVIVGVGMNKQYDTEAFRLRIAGIEENEPQDFMGHGVDAYGIARNTPLGPVNVTHWPNVYSYDLGNYLHHAQDTQSDRGAWFYLYAREDSD